MKVLSLFSGVGGFDMGLENAGMETVFQCEWDKHCRTILDRHWPTVPKWDDVSPTQSDLIRGNAPAFSHLSHPELTVLAANDFIPFKHLDSALSNIQWASTSSFNHLSHLCRLIS